MHRWLIAAALALPLLTNAQALKPEQLPSALRDWLPWAWQGHEAERCPPQQQDGAQRFCLWPAQLQLQADANGARFRYELELIGAPAHVSLPGDAALWPQRLLLDGKPLALTEREGRPSALLPPGRHRIEGEFRWRALPPDLAVPPGIASLLLAVDGGGLRAASVGAEGRLPLRAGGSATATEGDALQVRVVRRIDDGVAASLRTRWQLVVSGKPREVQLPHALLPGWQASGLDSPLPARLGDDGSLRLQARPGSWTLSLDARRLQPLQELALPKTEGIADEVWVFAADAGLRALTPSGATSLDPRQVDMPEDWRQLPAWRVQPGEVLRFAETRRGSAEAPADALNLRRKLWLDFDGGGYTVRDELLGSAQRSTRLSLAEPLLLGRAAVGGVDQALTRLKSEAGAGFELRDRQAQVQAEARLDGRARSLPASGWSSALQSVNTELRLPPGWQLLHATGPDDVDGSWASRWTLWDAFFLLLAAVGAARLLGWQSGLLLGAALLVGLQLEGAPSTAWWLLLLALGAVAGLLQAQPRAQGVLLRLRSAVALGLGLLLLLFAVQQLRLALHPGLEIPPHQAEVEMVQGPTDEQVEQREASRQTRSDAKRAVAALSKSVEDIAYPSVASPPPPLVDPRARVQTGPGLPDWQWRSHRLHWQGPVAPTVELGLWLLPPWATALWRVAALLLLGAALLRLLKGPGSGGGFAGWRAPLAALLAAVGIGTAAQAAPAPEPAQPWPSAEQLATLRQRTHAAPACLPRCAELARAQLSAEGGRLQLRLELHAQAEVAVPLPGQGRAWQPATVLRDGQLATTLRDERGQLWGLAPAGVSQWLLEADAGSAAQVEISLPLPLRALEVQLAGWQLGGLDARGLPGGALLLSRAAPTGGSAAEERGTPRDALAPLARITRRLSLGLEWQMETLIERIGESRAPLTLRWALLPGENVTDAAVQVQDGVAQLQLGAEEQARVASRLTPRAELRWLARPEPNQIELWELNASPLWRARWSGLNPVHHEEGGTWAPLWRPWPGEQLQLQLERPPGAPGGQTLTLQALTTTVSLGGSSAELTQQLQLRSSLGGEHKLQLPEGAELLGLKLNDQPLALQAPKGLISLPLTPGEHQLQLRWRWAQGSAALVRTPSLGLGATLVNDRLQVSLPQDRLLLLAGGPRLGPAVLIWSLLPLLLIAAWLMARWQGRRTGIAVALLGLGLAPASLGGLATVAGWFLLLQLRRQHAAALPRWAHNGLQVLLLLITLLALTALLDALRVGLLGYPELLVAGNGSSAHQLHWYADRVAEQSSSAWLLSAPLWVYRVGMLVWALWLANALLGWLRWAWAAASEGGLWRAAPPKIKPDEAGS